MLKHLCKEVDIKSKGSSSCPGCHHFSKLLKLNSSGHRSLETEGNLLLGNKHLAYILAKNLNITLIIILLSKKFSTTYLKVALQGHHTEQWRTCWDCTQPWCFLSHVALFYLSEFQLTKPWVLTSHSFVHLPHLSTHSSSGSARSSLWRPSQNTSTFRKCPSWFFADYDGSFFNNSPSRSPQLIVSPAHNHPATFCPLWAGNLETCNSSHFEWEISLAFQPTVCTKWQFSGGLGGAFPV